MSRASYLNNLGMGSTVPGPFVDPSNIYDMNRFKDRSEFVKAHVATRAGPLTSERGSVYEKLDPNMKKPNYTSLAETVEKEMGNCKPCIQDTAAAYGPPSAANVYTSYPVLAQFENRRKWTDNFAAPYVPPNKDLVYLQGGGPDGGAGMMREGNVRGGGGGGGGGGGSGGVTMGGPNNYMPSDNPTPPGNGAPRSRYPVPSKQQPQLIGCNLISSGEDQFAHRMTYLNRWFDEDDGEIRIGIPPTMKNKYSGEYGDELFKTTIDNTENKISTGIMVNPYTGEMFETFENAMPPPNKDKWIPRERFEIVNPKLLQMQGGLNPHAPLPKKKEIPLDVPGTDFGPNIWGDQLFEDERRRRMIDLVNRDIWNNRDGDYSTDLEFAKEKPAGYVGLNPFYRALPYLPPVNELDNHGYVPVTDYQAPGATSVKSDVTTHKPDLTTCPVVFGAGPMNDTDADYVVTQYNNRPTWRGGGDTYYSGPAYLPNQGAIEPLQKQNKPTLKEFMEQSFEPTNAQISTTESGGNGYVVTQTQNKPTLKEFMEQSYAPFGVANQVLDTGGNAYVVTQTQNKPTLKEFMEQSYAPLNATTATTESGGNLYVVQQTQNKPTLKEFMEQSYAPLNATTATTESGGNLYVVQQTQNKPTLKEFMEQSYAPLNATTATTESGGNLYVVTQTQNKPTLKEFMEEEFPVNLVQPNMPEESYVVTQYENRPTLKQLMQEEFSPLNFSDGGDHYSGSYSEFQGPLLEVARAYYEWLPPVGRPASFANGVGGDYVGNGMITTRQNRGTDSLNWTTLSKVPTDAEDTSVRWIGVYDRDTKRELVQNIPMSDLASSYQSVAPRMIGALTPQCNLDLRGEIDDEFSWTHGFAPQIQDVITG